MQNALLLPVPGPVPAAIAPPPAPRSEDTPPEPFTDAEPAAHAAPVPILLFGLDQRGRPHAACFSEQEMAAVERAADLMDLFCVAAETDALRDLGPKLPVGRLFRASGKAFIPYTSSALYDRLLAAAGITEAPRPVKAAGKPAEAEGGAGGKAGGASGGAGAGSPGGNGGDAKPKADWSALKPGFLVLAEDEDTGGFYPARIVATKADAHVQLVWEGFPDLPEFARPCRALALFHPEAAEAAE